MHGHGKWTLFRPTPLLLFKNIKITFKFTSHTARERTIGSVIQTTLATATRTGTLWAQWTQTDNIAYVKIVI